MLSLPKRASKQSGTTLIEIVIVSGVLIMVMTAIVSLMVAATARNRRAKESAVATRLSQEGAEWLKNEFASQPWIDYINFLSNSGNTDVICLADLSTVPPEYNVCGPFESVTSAGSNPAYFRNINLEFDKVAPNTTHVIYTVTTTWGETGSSEVTGTIYRRSR